MILVLKRETCRRILKSLLLWVIVYSNVAASITRSTAAPSVRRGKTFARLTARIVIQSTSSLEVPCILRLRFELFTSGIQSNRIEDALGEGLSTGHPSMPEFRLDAGQIGDFISFLKSLEQ
jgi:cytochrome c